MISFVDALYARVFLDDFQEGRIISRQNLNEYIETIHLAPTQFCDLPGIYCKAGFLRCHPLILDIFILF